MHHTLHLDIQEKIKAVHDRVAEGLSTHVPGALVSSSVDYDYPVFVVAKESIHEVLTWLKTGDPGFTFLTTLCGVHFPDNKGQEFGMVYHLHNLEKNERIRIKLFTGSKEMDIPTATDLWPAANWMEREAYDFYGFRFVGHPDLRRILNMDEMNYFPLRKEYPLEDAGRADKEDKFFGR